MKSFRDESGQTLVFTALLMCVLMGFMALAIDIGVLFRAQRKLQTAADAAAIAAGLTYYYSGNPTTSTCGTGVGAVKCAAINAANANGVTNSSQVTVNLPPVYGSHTGSSYVEVLINQPTPTIFMGAFSGLFPGGSSASLNPMTVGARAVSGITPGRYCVYALDPTADDAFDVQGAANVQVPNCSVIVDSNSQQAICTTGGKATINALAINIVGAQNPKGKCNGTQANATTGVLGASDPLAGLATPTCDGTNTFPGTTITSSNQISGKTFTPKTETTGSGPTATTASVVCFSGSNVTIAGGVTLGTSETAGDGSGKTVGGKEIFVFENGLQLGGSVTVYGTVDLAGGVYAQNNDAFNLAAPANSSYTYNGIGLWVPATNATPQASCGGSYSSFKGTPAPGGCLQIQFGSGSFGTSNLDGMIYAPDVAIYMQDNGGGSVVTAIIADEIYDKSSSLVITNNYNLVHTTSPLNQVSLVE